MGHTYALGIDIGSTTAKVVLTDGTDILYQRYERHLSQVRQKLYDMFAQMRHLLEGQTFTAAISGSAGMGLAEAAGVPFVQEVYATSEVIRALEPGAGTVIELGGEDAKVIFFKGGVDERMNGSCAGGTGAFIDQMATLLDMTVEEMDALSLQAERIYPIASRCGVFAKTDIQPLLNQGARKADVAASIYQAVVNQTIAGLIQGRRIEKKVLFLGGPLYYCKGLRRRFQETLKLGEDEALFPEYGRFAVAIGASIYARRTGSAFTADTLEAALRRALEGHAATGRLKPLFQSDAERAAFEARHARADVPRRALEDYSGDAWLGIDCGSTTTKLALLSGQGELLYSFYGPNLADPVGIIRERLTELRALCGDRVRIAGSAVTGYGEELIKSAFGVDMGVVETIAHYTAARHFRPDVDYIIDIGGQDIKCFRIRGGAIDSITLNEACSSGCGSFIETFARSMGYTAAEFARLGLDSRAPVNLGSRCTVFMNSSVKQSQKEGATVEDISAGLSISVVKNAIYKVIRVNSASELGRSVVVQGGTFLNDAVLRAFEMELGAQAVRPVIAGLMGAYGAALCAMKVKRSTLIDRAGLAAFEHTAKPLLCNGCTNHCHLTVNTFSGGRRFISGNQCEKGAGIKLTGEPLPNMYEFKRERLYGLEPGENRRGRVGLPMALGMLELAPLWHGIFTSLGFQVVLSGRSTRAVYEKGQFSIPSDTACYPAKIMHGHIETLIDAGVDAIFYPCLSYNLDEGGDNHYNCPVVAYYAQLLNGNMERLRQTRFLYPFLNINSERELEKEFYRFVREAFPEGKFTRGEVRRAVRAGLSAQRAYAESVRAEGERCLKWARERGKPIMILAGRPYHIDPEISHGIDKLAVTLGFVVVSEDGVSHLCDMPRVRVLNQWTYHSRLYRAAMYATRHADAQLVQLVSFGCGVDAITTDEVRSILESAGKYYTQIKIDEITNLGAVKIRLRSLIGALEEKGEQHAG